MESIFRLIHKLGPAGIVLKAIFAALVADGLLLAFILLRRSYRKRYFAKRDARVFHFRAVWEQLISGKIPYLAWRGKIFDRRVVESLALDALEAAPPEGAARVLNFLRVSGLLQTRIYEARKYHGWRRRKALVALGQTRAAEGIAALAEGLRDSNAETRLAALRGLGRTGLPAAAEEILRWVGERGLVVPALPLENALMNCCRERPQLVPRYMAAAHGELRELLGRVLGEVATQAMDADLTEMAGDQAPEVRASAARALGNARPKSALPVLAEMVKDPVWFVRLRATVALGQLRTVRAISALLLALTDSHRLVRLRAAQALADQDEDGSVIFAAVADTEDTYAIDAYITAAENAGIYGELLEKLRTGRSMEEERRRHLLDIASRKLAQGPGIHPGVSAKPDAVAL